MQSSLGVFARFIASDDRLIRTELSRQRDFSCEIVGGSSALQATILSWVEHYMRGESTPFQGTIDIESFTPFQKEVWGQLLLLPVGTTCSYGQIAARLHKPGAARAVGNACGRNPCPWIIPCHRVIHHSGALGGFSIDLAVKSELLRFEKQILSWS
jgi:methylated-DNA-[protein]-cysteine S-methyltransferase